MAGRKPPQFAPVADDRADLVADGALSMARAARFCGLSTKGFRAFVTRGEVESFKVGSRRVVPRRALVKFLARKLTESHGK